MKYIYALVDPRTRMIHYVGQTDDVDRRYSEHLKDASDTTKVAWLSELRALDFKPHVHVLQQCENEDVYYIENWWIALGRRQGWPLTNGTKPGEWRFKDDFTQIYGEHLLQMEDDYKRKLILASIDQQTLIETQQRKIEQMEAEAILSATQTERSKWISRLYVIAYFVVCVCTAVAVYGSIVDAFSINSDRFLGLTVAFGWLVFPWFSSVHWMVRKEKKGDLLLESGLWVSLFLSTLGAVNAIYNLGGMSK